MKSLTNDIFIRTSCLLDNRLEYCGGTAFHGNIFAPWHLTLTLCQMAAGVKPCLRYTTVRPLRRFTVKPEYTCKQNSAPSFSLRGRTPLIFPCVKQWVYCMNQQLLQTKGQGRHNSYEKTRYICIRAAKPRQEGRMILRTASLFKPVWQLAHLWFECMFLPNTPLSSTLLERRIAKHWQKCQDVFFMWRNETQVLWRKKKIITTFKLCLMMHFQRTSSTSRGCSHVKDRR